MTENPDQSSKTDVADPELLDTAPPGAMCLGCRYDIGGMDIRAKCHECGDRIAPSVNFISLEHAPPAFLSALDRGTRGLNKAGALDWPASSFYPPATR